MDGHVYGRLTVRSFAGVNKHGGSLWVCECECGTQITASSNHLRTGCVKSCGCLNDEQRIRVCVERATHGKARRIERSRIYGIWANMMARCCNQNRSDYAHYGARGITVCDRWRDFELFYADAGDPPKGLSLDRIDVNGNYEPGNVRWATQIQQMNNTRYTKRHDFMGELLTVREASEKYGISYRTLKSRINLMKMSPCDAVSTPLMPRVGNFRRGRALKGPNKAKA